MAKVVVHDQNNDGIDRSGFLGCMTCASTGVVWTVGGGILGSAVFDVSTVAEHRK